MARSIYVLGVDRSIWIAQIWIRAARSRLSPSGPTPPIPSPVPGGLYRARLPRRFPETATACACVPLRAPSAVEKRSARAGRRSRQSRVTNPQGLQCVLVVCQPYVHIYCVINKCRAQIILLGGTLVPVRTHAQPSAPNPPANAAPRSAIRSAARSC